jgi:predicted PhzF superfamily epimerase YddE/YHI9
MNDGTILASNAVLHMQAEAGDVSRNKKGTTWEQSRLTHVSTVRPIAAIRKCLPVTNDAYHNIEHAMITDTGLIWIIFKVPVVLEFFLLLSYHIRH